MVEVFWCIMISGKPYNHSFYCEETIAKRAIEILAKKKIICGIWTTEESPEDRKMLCLGGKSCKTGLYQFTWL